MKLKPKGPGHEIMISNLIPEHDGFLKLRDEALIGTTRGINRSSKVHGSSLSLGMAPKHKQTVFCVLINLGCPVVISHKIKLLAH